MDAATIRGVPPNTVSHAAWSNPGSGGNVSTIELMTAAKTSAPNPHHTTRRDRAYPYTSVSTSPNTYEIGKKITPAPNTNGPTCTRFAAEIKLLHSSTVTNAARIRS